MERLREASTRGRHGGGPGSPQAGLRESRGGRELLKMNLTRIGECIQSGRAVPLENLLFWACSDTPLAHKVGDRTVFQILKAETKGLYTASKGKKGKRAPKAKLAKLLIRELKGLGPRTVSISSGLKKALIVHCIQQKVPDYVPTSGQAEVDVERGFIRGYLQFKGVAGDLAQSLGERELFQRALQFLSSFVSADRSVQVASQRLSWVEVNSFIDEEIARWASDLDGIDPELRLRTLSLILLHDFEDPTQANLDEEAFAETKAEYLLALSRFASTSDELASLELQARTRPDYLDQEPEVQLWEPIVGEASDSCIFQDLLARVAVGLYFMDKASSAGGVGILPQLRTILQARNRLDVIKMYAPIVLSDLFPDIRWDGVDGTTIRPAFAVKALIYDSLLRKRTLVEAQRARFSEMEEAMAASFKKQAKAAQKKAKKQAKVAAAKQAKQATLREARDQHKRNWEAYVRRKAAENEAGATASAADAAMRQQLQVTTAKKE